MVRIASGCFKWPFVLKNNLTYSNLKNELYKPAYLEGYSKKNIARLQNAAQSTSHLLSRCQVVLIEGLFKFCHKLSFVTV